MDKRIVNTYVRKIATKDLEQLVNVMHIAINGSPDQAKALMLSVLLEDETMSEIECCLKWFELNGISASESEGSIYVLVGSNYELEITPEEVSYRAELYKDTREEPK